MVHLTIDVPAEAWAGLRIAPENFARELRVAAAAMRGTLRFGPRKLGSDTTLSLRFMR